MHSKKQVNNSGQKIQINNYELLSTESGHHGRHISNQSVETVI